METRKTLSSFVIEGALKEDEGPYSITVTNPAGEDNAEIFVTIVGRWRFHTSALSCSNLAFCVVVQLLFIMTESSIGPSD